MLVTAHNTSKSPKILKSSTNRHISLLEQRERKKKALLKRSFYRKVHHCQKRQEVTILVGNGSEKREEALRGMSFRDMFKKNRDSDIE